MITLSLLSGEGERVVWGLDPESFDFEVVEVEGTCEGVCDGPTTMLTGASVVIDVAEGVVVADDVAGSDVVVCDERIIVFAVVVVVTAPVEATPGGGIANVDVELSFWLCCDVNDVSGDGVDVDARMFGGPTGVCVHDPIMEGWL